MMTSLQRMFPIMSHLVSILLLVSFQLRLGSATSVTQDPCKKEETTISPMDKARGSTDPITLLNRIDELEIKLATLTQKVDYTSAFSVTIKGTTSMNTVPDTILRLPDVVLQIGEGYDVDTGVFTAPVDGLYNFHLIVYQPGHCALNIHLFINNERLARFGSYQGHWEQTSISHIAKLLRGDMVYAVPLQSCAMYAYEYTFFSGNLLQTL